MYFAQRRLPLGLQFHGLEARPGADGKQQPSGRLRARATAHGSQDGRALSGAAIAVLGRGIELTVLYRRSSLGMLPMPLVQLRAPRLAVGSASCSCFDLVSVALRVFAPSLTSYGQVKCAWR
jgi:hypothetical protein